MRRRAFGVAQFEVAEDHQQEFAVVGRQAGGVEGVAHGLGVDVPEVDAAAGERLLIVDALSRNCAEAERIHTECIFNVEGGFSKSFIHALSSSGLVTNAHSGTSPLRFNNEANRNDLVSAALTARGLVRRQDVELGCCLLNSEIIPDNS